MTTLVAPRVAAITANLTCVDVVPDPIRSAEYTAPSPSCTPIWAPLRSVTFVTLCHFADGRAETVLSISCPVDGPALEPTTVRAPAAVPSEIPFASWLRTFQVEL